MALPDLPPATLPSILVVDDEAPHRALLLEIFSQPGLQVWEACNALEALAILERRRPDLVLLDNNMPGMTGIELCHRLRSEAAWVDLPIILVTALNDPLTLSRGLQAGADDFVGKPYSPIELEARVRSHLLRSRAQQAASHYQQRLLAERQLVERLVLRMRKVAQHDDRGVAVMMTSVENTTGDMILSIANGAGGQCILVGDFTGHGLPAAMGGPLVSYIFANMASGGATMGAILAEINRELVLRTPVDVYLAATILEVAPDRRRLTLFNGGMPAVLLREESGALRCLASDNLPLGIVELAATEFVTREVILSGTETLLLFSDGAIEQLSPAGECFGMERLEAEFLSCANPGGLLTHLLQRLQDFAGGHGFADDITLLAFRPGEDPGTESPKTSAHVSKK